MHPSLKQIKDILINCDILGEEELNLQLINTVALKIKFGCDPTASDIHLGHCVILEKLRLLQNLGHEIIFVIGNFTSLVGDPTGKNALRPRMTQDTIKDNVVTYTSQIFRILDPIKTQIVYNASWLADLKFIDIINLLSKITVSQLLQRQDFKNRLNSNSPIFVHEILYPILQGYDSVVLKNDVEIGGSDQLFNCLMGRELQKSYNQKPQIVITCPVIPGTDGTMKMSKSLKNYISLTDEHMFAKVMSLSDALMRIYAVNLNIDIMIPADCSGINMRNKKMELAFYITNKYQGAEIAERQRNNFINVVQNKGTSDKIVVLHTNETHLKLLYVLKELQLVPSSGYYRRLISQNAIFINNIAVQDINTILAAPVQFTCRIGKKISILIQIVQNHTS